ncbi:hypothetical protein ACKFKF_28425 [Phormidesmis sp. 146-12]
MTTQKIRTLVKPPEEVDDFQEDPPNEPEIKTTHNSRPVSKIPASKVLIDGETYSAVEGDLLLDDDELDLYHQHQQARIAQREAVRFAEAVGFGEAAITTGILGNNSLIGIVQGGKIVRWSPGTVLTYCVLRHTFPRDEWYEEVVDNMRAATIAWEEICGITFAYRSDHDDSGMLRPPGIAFPVRHISANGAFIAAAFFPNDPVNRHRVLIDPSYFTTRFDRVGVLRHELGHVLGFRHEHIRSGAPPVCPRESTTGTIDLTAYDPQSVMHYFCGGVGGRTLAITDVDRAGAQSVYGPSLRSFELVEL